MINTKIIEIYDENDKDNILKVANYLKNGKLCAVPTETVYGLAGNIYCKEAIENIYKAKGRPCDNPLIVHVDSIDMANNLIKNKTDILAKLQKAFWPGPLTIVCEKNDNVPFIISRGLNTIAIRIPRNKVFLDIIKNTGAPLAAPSANLSGLPSPTSFKHVVDDLDGRVDCIVKSLNSDVGLESTVVSIVDDKPVLLRPGAITKEMLYEVIGEITIDEHILKKADSDIKVISPGVKYKHYAPKTNLILVKANKTKFALFLKNTLNKSDDKIGLITYLNEYYNDIPSVTIGSIDDEKELSKNLFSTLRDIDKLNVDVVFCRLNKDICNYDAFYNRILRASGFEVIVCE